MLGCVGMLGVAGGLLWPAPKPPVTAAKNHMVARTSRWFPATATDPPAADLRKFGRLGTPVRISLRCTGQGPSLQRPKLPPTVAWPPV